MKKYLLSVSLFIICVALCTSNLYAACTVTRGKVEVSQGTGSSCSSIQSAVNLADGLNPLLVSVLPGTYTDTITIANSKVHLQGAGRNVAIISPSSAGNAITIGNNLDNVIVSGFTIKNNGYSSSDAAIRNNSSSVVIKDNKIVIDSVGYGIYNDSVSTTTLIEGNLIEGFSSNETGIYNNQSSSLQIRGNSFKGFGNINIWNASSSSVISGNTIENAGWGIYCTGSPITISGNIIVGASGGSQGIIDNCSSVIINNRVTGNPTNDIGGSTSNVSFNIFDKGSVGIGKYNVKSDGTPW